MENCAGLRELSAQELHEIQGGAWSDVLTTVAIGSALAAGVLIMPELLVVSAIAGGVLVVSSSL